MHYNLIIYFQILFCLFGFLYSTDTLLWLPGENTSKELSKYLEQLETEK